MIIEQCIVQTIGHLALLSFDRLQQQVLVRIADANGHSGFCKEEKYTHTNFISIEIPPCIKKAKLQIETRNAIIEKIISLH